MSESSKHAESLIAAARAAGAHSAEALVVGSESRRCDTARGPVRRSAETHASIRVITHDGRVGVAEGGFEPAALVTKALEGAQKDEGGSGLGPRLDVPTMGLGILDPRQAGLDDGQRASVIEDALDDCAGVDPRVVPGDFVYDEVVQERGFATSSGVVLGSRSTRYRLTGTARLRESPLEAVGSITSRNFAEVASKPLGVELARRAVMFGRTAPLPETAVPVALAPQVIEALLPRVARAFRAELVESGNSFLSGRLERPFGGGLLHIVDDASMPGGYATRAFDDRGIPPLPVNLVKEGAVGGMYQGVESAREADVRPSGHETWDGSAWLGNLVVRAGNRSRNMVFPELGTLVLVEQVHAVEKCDIRTGEIVLQVLPVRYEASECQGACGIQRLCLSVDDLFGRVTHVLNDHVRLGVVDTPTWVLEGPWFG